MYRSPKQRANGSSFISNTWIFAIALPNCFQTQTKNKPINAYFKALSNKGLKTLLQDGGNSPKIQTLHFPTPPSCDSAAHPQGPRLVVRSAIVTQSEDFLRSRPRAGKTAQLHASSCCEVRGSLVSDTERDTARTRPGS